MMNNLNIKSYFYFQIKNKKQESCMKLKYFTCLIFKKSFKLPNILNLTS